MSYIPGSLEAPEGLLRDLDEIYPHRCPDPTDSPAAMWMKAGARQLLDGLWEKLRDSNQGPLLHVQ